MTQVLSAAPDRSLQSLLYTLNQCKWSRRKATRSRLLRVFNTAWYCATIACSMEASSLSEQINFSVAVLAMTQSNDGLMMAGL